VLDCIPVSRQPSAKLSVAVSLLRGCEPSLCSLSLERIFHCDVDPTFPQSPVSTCQYPRPAQPMPTL
jgi:hypothetical protein